jgi:hypothetical protein
VDAHPDHADPIAGPVRAAALAGRHAGHRPPRTTPPRRPTPPDRPRRLAHHLLRHQHHRGRLDTTTLELRHRQRARAEDRIRALKDTGLRNLPYHGYAHNQIWLEIVALAADLLTWTQTLAYGPTQPARRWEPKRMRLRILTVAGRITHTSRRRHLRLPRGWPWAHLIHTGWAALRT